MTAEEIRNTEPPIVNYDFKTLKFAESNVKGAINWWERLKRREYYWWLPERDKNQPEDFIEANIDYFKRYLFKIQNQLKSQKNESI